MQSSAALKHIRLFLGPRRRHLHLFQTSYAGLPPTLPALHEKQSDPHSHVRIRQQPVGFAESSYNTNQDRSEEDGRNVRLRKYIDIFGEERGTHRNFWVGQRQWRICLTFHNLKVNPHRRSRACTREPVDGNPRQNCIGLVPLCMIWSTPYHTFVVFPGIIVRPVVQFFVDPREQANRTISQRVTDRLRLGALSREITAASVLEPLCAC